MNNLLLVEDDPSLGASLEHALTQHGWHVTWMNNGDSADTMLRTQTFDMIILDWNLPKQSGLSLVKTIRRNKQHTPILMLTARDTINDKIQAFEDGADDYLVKPFALAELKARLQALLRRHVGSTNNKLTWQHIELDLDRYQANLHQQPVELSKLEFDLLYLLMQRPEYPVSKERIIDTLYQARPDVSINAIEALVSQLRKKIGTDTIKTMRGIGYVLGKARQDNISSV